MTAQGTLSHAKKDTAFPWHSGERAVQARVGVADQMADMGKRVIRDYMPDQHRTFYQSLPFVVLGSVDPSGDVWATVRTGTPGFLTSPEPRTLTANLARDRLDPADAGMEDGNSIGMLGIELSTRRRNRLNGTIHRQGDSGFACDVVHSFGNCPQYIQLRNYKMIRDADAPSDADSEELSALDHEAKAMIAKADTFFVASYVTLEGGEKQVDVSHRGGKPGFVRVDDTGMMTIPDFAGNLMFNTLGNFTANPRGGLIFIDFQTGDTLQLTGTTEVIFDSPEIDAFQGAERLWTLKPIRIVRRRGALALRFDLKGKNAFSHNSLITGSWQEAQARLEAKALHEAWRPFRIARIVDEATSIKSFWLEPADGKGRIAHKAGQFLPIRLMVPGQGKPVMRTYTLSVAPSDKAYRISVKKDGIASSFLHDTIKVGDVIEARGPAGDFTIDLEQKTRGAVLVAAGIGITPMLAMLRSLVFEGVRTRGMRPTWLVYQATTASERAFDAEIEQLEDLAQGALKVIRFSSRPAEDERPGIDYNAAGRIQAADFSSLLPFGDHDFYLCGPGSFMQNVYDGLRDMRVPDDRIHAEAFGPASLKRQFDGPTANPDVEPAATESVPVIFTESAKEARWEPDANPTLLELAEERGIEAPHSCRTGNCGACAIKLLKGQVAKMRETTAPTGEGEVLMCSVVPAKDSDPIQLEL